ncbi:MAG: tetratricopeptide repeat protein [Bryobacteraceae bacterium]
MTCSKRVLLILALAGVCRAAPADNVRLCHENAASNPDVAIPACTAAIGSGQLSGADLASASLDRGIAYLAKEDYDRAIRDFDQAIRGKPDLAAAFENRCKANLRKHDDARALPDCEQAIRLDPKAALPVYGRGMIRFNSGDYERATLDIEQAIRLDPKLAAAYSGRAALHIRRGQYDQAIQDYGQVLRLGPDARGYYGRGWCYVRKGDYESALRDFEQAIRLQPNSAQGYSGRGYVHIKRHEYDQAIQDYDQALRLRPDAKDYDMRGWIYYRKGDYLSALPDFVRASWRRSAILGRWTWTLLVPAAWLIYMVLRRRRKAKEAGRAVPDRPPVELVTVLETGDSFALDLAKASLEEAGIEYSVSGGDPLGLAESHRIFPNAPGRCQIQVARESESEARALLEALRNPSPIEDQAEEL